MQAHKLWVCVKRIIFHERANLGAQGSTVPSPCLIATMALCAIDCSMTEHGEVITEQQKKTQLVSQTNEKVQQL